MRPDLSLRGAICPKCKVLMRPIARSQSHVEWQCLMNGCGYWAREPIGTEESEYSGKPFHGGHDDDGINCA